MFRQPYRVVIALILLISATVARAQTGTSGIVGNVRDSSGGAIPGATVRVVNDDTGSASQTISDAQGAFRADVTPGRYTIEVSLDGFESFRRQVAVVAAQLITTDVTLSPSRLTESVVVTARRVEEKKWRKKCPFRCRSWTASSRRTLVRST